MRLPPLIAGVVTVALVLGGCGTNAAKPGGAKPVPQRQRADGRLLVPASPLAVSDLDKVPAGSPERAVLELWFWAQWGSGPNVTAAYDPEVRRAIGSANITGAYAQQRASLEESAPRIVARRRTSQGTFVALKVISASDPPRSESFTLRKRAGEWKIIQDTVLEQAIAVYVQSLVDGPNAKAASPRATRAGIDAAKKYREAFLHLRRGPNSGGDQAGRSR